jgi:hypothetical protein
MKGPCTVEKYLLVLSSKLTQYDMKESAKEMRRGGMNIYRLGHLLKAAKSVENDVKALARREDPEAMAKLQQSLSRHFEDGFSPARAVKRQIAAGKCSLVRR